MKDTDRKIESFFTQFRVLHYSQSETLFSAQDKPPGIFYLKKGRGIILNQKFTHHDIATMVGITREHVSLEMEKLKKEGFSKV